MARYRKKPVVVEAMLWTGREEDVARVFEMLGEAELPNVPDDPHVQPGLGYIPPMGTLDIPTLEGMMTAQPGDWIIRGIKGELYPCKPDIFEMTYEPAPTSDDNERGEEDESE